MSGAANASRRVLVTGVVINLLNPKLTLFFFAFLPQFVPAGAPQRPALRAGEHLFAQTAQTFRYLRDRVESGELVLPDGSLQTGQFGQQAIHGVVNCGRVS